VGSIPTEPTPQAHSASPLRKPTAEPTAQAHCGVVLARLILDFLVPGDAHCGVWAAAAPRRPEPGAQGLQLYGVAQRRQRYGVVVETLRKPDRSRTGREYSVESL
jgi:hypothetical protein